MARCYAMWGEAGVPAAHRHLRTSAAAGERPAWHRSQGRVQQPADRRLFGRLSPHLTRVGFVVPWMTRTDPPRRQRPKSAGHKDREESG